MSLVIMGEYDDMKYLVRDGSKKLREASELPDDSLLTANRSRGGSPSLSGNLSPRKRVSTNILSSQRNVGNTPNKARSMGYSQSVPKLKGHPRDRPSNRKLDEKSRLREAHGHPTDSDRGRNGTTDADWGGALSFSRGFHSIWNCGGTGEDTGTISPTQVVSPKDGKSHPVDATPAPYRPIFEGRGDANHGHGREGGVSTRAN